MYSIWDEAQGPIWDEAHGPIWDEAHGPIWDEARSPRGRSERPEDLPTVDERELELPVPVEVSDAHEEGVHARQERESRVDLRLLCVDSGQDGAREGVLGEHRLRGLEVSILGSRVAETADLVRVDGVERARTIGDVEEEALGRMAMEGSGLLLRHGDGRELEERLDRGVGTGASVNARSKPHGGGGWVTVTRVGITEDTLDVLGPEQRFSESEADGARVQEAIENAPHRTRALL